MLMHCNISCLPLNALHLSLFPLSRDTCMEEIEKEEGCAREKDRDRERERERDRERQREREREIVSLEAIDGKSTPGQDRTGDLQRVRLTS